MSQLSTADTSKPVERPLVILIWNLFRDECVTLVSAPGISRNWARLDGICIEGDSERGAWFRLALQMEAGGSFTEDQCTDELLREWWQFVGVPRRDVGSPLELVDDPALPGASVVSVFLSRSVDRPQSQTAKTLARLFGVEPRSSTLHGSGLNRAEPDCLQHQPDQAASPPMREEPHEHLEIDSARSQTLPA